jgi:hypothetical protein
MSLKYNISITSKAYPFGGYVFISKAHSWPWLLESQWLILFEVAPTSTLSRVVIRQDEPILINK